MPERRFRYICEVFNDVSVWNDEVLKDLKFACELELSDVVPAFKKHDSNSVQNYRPISLCQLSQRFLWELCLINLPPT